MKKRNKQDYPDQVGMPNKGTVKPYTDPGGSIHGRQSITIGAHRAGATPVSSLAAMKRAAAHGAPVLRISQNPSRWPSKGRGR